MEANDRQAIISGKSLFRLQHVFNLIGRRIVPCYFFTYNHKEFMRWQFNACRQTAIICAYFLDQLAERINERVHNIHGGPAFVASAWDSHFSSVFDAPYNHAWAFMDSQESLNEQVSEGLFVDVSRITYPTLVQWGVNDPERQFNNHPMTPLQNSVVFTERGPRECLPWKDLLDEREYYTGKKGWEICRDIESLLNGYSMDFKTFDLQQ
jgi:hypothetical protein